MTLLHLDSFQADRTQASFARRYIGLNDIPTTFPNTRGRFGGRAFPGALEVNPILSSRSFQTINLNASDNTVVVGCRVRCACPSALFNLFDILDSSGTSQFSLQLSQTAFDTGGGWHFQFKRGVTVIDTTTEWLGGTLVSDFANAWHYIELKVNVHPSSGFFELRVDNAVLYKQEGPINTANTGSAGWQRVKLSPVFSDAVNGFYDLDDLYVLDGNSGQAPSDFLGPGVVEATFPFFDGDLSEWVGLQIPAPDQDAETIDDGRLGEVDDDLSYVFAFAPAVSTFEFDRLRRLQGSVVAIQATMDARSDASDPFTLEQGGRFESSNWWGTPIAFSSSTSYARYVGIAAFNIGNGKPWDTEQIKRTQFGVRCS